MSKLNANAAAALASLPKTADGKYLYLNMTVYEVRFGLIKSGRIIGLYNGSVDILYDETGDWKNISVFRKTVFALRKNAEAACTTKVTS